jgi:hypothetical protein
VLRLLEQPDSSALTALRAAPLAPAAVPNPLPAPSAVRRPSRGWRLRQFAKNLRDGSLLVPLLARVARCLGLMVGYGELRGRVAHADGTVTELGLLGRRVITDAGVAYLAADMAGGANDINLFKFHGFGTGSTAEAANQTALVTELTTQYATDNTRPTGSQSSSTNTYTTVGTLSPDASCAITEHGLFTATSAGTLWDRTVFSAVNLVSGDSLQATYVLTLPSGG